MTQTLSASRINNPHACICCGRRPEGLAVGNPDRLGWYCNQCNSDLAKVALAMAIKKDKELDTYERKACQRVAKLSGLSEFTLTSQELPDFVAWAVTEFAKAMRDELETGTTGF